MPSGPASLRWSPARRSSPSGDRTRGGPIPGVLSEAMVFSEQELVHVPANLDLVQAATLPCAAITAWSALELAGVRAGDTVLVLGSGGTIITTESGLKACQAEGVKAKAADLAGSLFYNAPG